MTYLNFLIVFLGIPLAGLALLHWLGRARPHRGPLLGGMAAVAVILVHVVVAVVYTTPWDNYLVANGVWYYDPTLVLGITFGWVPLEEYLFFALQPLLTGGWLMWLAPRLAKPNPDEQLRQWLRWAAPAGMGLIWIAAVAGLLLRWQPGTYLGLELGWALPPIMLQLAVGADLLWRQRRLAAVSILSATLYLCAADALAIGAGTWTISPAHSVNLLVAGLPIEEIIFFLTTNTLIVFGITLALTPETHARLLRVRRWLQAGLPNASTGPRPAARFVRDG